MRVIFYGTHRYPVYEFISKSSIDERAKILGCLKNVQELSFESARVDFRQIEGKLWEIKIRSVSGGFRIFYTLVKERTLILLHAYHKKTQKAPTKEIKIAIKRMA